MKRQQLFLPIVLLACACSRTPVQPQQKPVMDKLVTAIDQDQPPKGHNFATFFPHPTGTNAFEDYMKAADAYENSKQYPVMYQLLKSQNATPAGRKAAMSTFGNILALIEHGNQRSECLPPKSKVDSIMPSFLGLTHLKVLTKLGVQYALYQIESGDPTGATRTYGDLIRMADRTEVQSLIASLVSIACRAIVANSVIDHRAELSHADTAALVALLDEATDSTIRIQSVVRSDAETSQTALVAGMEKEFAKQNARVWLAMLADDASAAQRAEAERVSRLPVEEQRQVLKTILRADKLLADQFAKMLELPESKWDFKPQESGTSKLLPSPVDAFKKFGQAAAKDRQRMRLCALSLLVEQYKRKNGHLPTTLADAVGSRAHDPLSEHDFGYKVTGTTYNIWSDGGIGLPKLDLSLKVPSRAQAGLR